MVTSLTGVSGDLAVLLVRVVFKRDLGTAPIHRRSTMALTAKDLATKPSNVMYRLAQVKGFFPINVALHKWCKEVILTMFITYSCKFVHYSTYPAVLPSVRLFVHPAIHFIYLFPNHRPTQPPTRAKNTLNRVGSPRGH